MPRRDSYDPSRRFATLGRVALGAALVALLAAPAWSQVGRSGLQGTAIDEEGQPVAGLELTITPLGDTAGREQVIETDRRGRFSSRFLASGRYLIDVRDQETYYLKEAKVEIRDSGGMALHQYEMLAHPVDGLTAVPIQGGQVTNVDLVITGAAYGAQLRRQVETGAVRGDLEELADLYNAGHTEEALARGLALLEEHPDLPDVLHIVGLAHSRQDRLDEAEPMLRRALELAPEQADIQASLGTVLLERARELEQREQDATSVYAEAEGLLGQAAAGMDPPPVPLLVNHSIALEGAGKTDESIAVLERVAAEDPENLTVRFRLAALLRADGQPERALEVLATLPGGADVQAADSLYNVAVSFYNESDYDGAEAALQRAAEVDPEHALVQRLLARVYYAKGEPGTAITHLRRFLELAPDHPEAEMEREMLRFLEQEAGG